MFVVEHSGDFYLFDSPFLGQDDEYSEFYLAYRLPWNVGDSVQKLQDWRDLASKGTQVGRVKVIDVRFDETKRLWINEEVFTLLVR